MTRKPVKEILPDVALSGYTKGYQIYNSLYVSPAVHELIQDDEVRDIVMKQVKVIDVSKNIDQLIREITTKHKEIKK
jgi:hypothetical protein